MKIKYFISKGIQSPTWIIPWLPLWSNNGIRVDVRRKVRSSSWYRKSSRQDVGTCPVEGSDNGGANKYT